MIDRERRLSDAELAGYQTETEAIQSPMNDNRRVRALIRQQSDPKAGYPRLLRNLETYRNISFSQIEINTVPVQLMCNQTRLQSLTSETFEKMASRKSQTCFLCHLDVGQRGVSILDDQFLVLTNPGITFPGDLTIATKIHQPQMIIGHFYEMIELARLLTDFSIFFNGALAGASSPHLHFQAGFKNMLIGETQIQSLLNGEKVGEARLKSIIQQPEINVFFIENYLRTSYVITSVSEQLLETFFNHFIEAFTIVSRQIVGNSNVPDFGSYIDSLEMTESEPRMNLMLKFDPETGKYLLAIFPKRFNRPSCYFRNDDQKLVLGMAIKESLGNVITGNHKDFNRLIQHPELIAEAYRDTSTTDEMACDLYDRLKTFPGVSHD
ncbi:MAG: hypothetical protein COT43_02125 [Candidatus Marinimicrobia bacterium CG08_land_8_20_14_0_20_45_22]|nr:MAG: hypothetical protein COT43_02125 [Candidatus Marinimicrobia bacterium CG08_land_8_20_14_0_20_45_22]